MRFYSHQHQFYCGIDLHARSMFLCIMDQSGQVLLHRNYQACPNALLKAIAPFREDIAVAVDAALMDTIHLSYARLVKCAHDSDRLQGHQQAAFSTFYRAL
jgi:hypothetical protein